MNKINHLYYEFHTHCLAKQENSIIFFFLLEGICGRNYRTLKQEFVAQKLVLTQVELQKIKNLVKRSKDYPWQYLVNKCLFYGDWYVIEQPVFIPRHTSERLIEIIMLEVKLHEKINVIWEVGVGSGALLARLDLLFPNATLYGTDICPIALKQANINCPRAQLWLHDWVTECSLVKNVELIYANPPYIQRGEDVDPLTNSESSKALYGVKKHVIQYYDELLMGFKHSYTFLKYLFFEISTSLLSELMEKMKKIECEVSVFASYSPTIKFVMLKKKHFLLNEPIKKKDFFIRANELLQKNQIIVYPTDTCLGIIARVNASNMIKINIIKGRNVAKKSPILFTSFSQLKQINSTFYHHFVPFQTVIYASGENGARRIFTNKYSLQSLIKANGPLLASSWNHHSQPVIKEIKYEVIRKFKMIDAFFCDRAYVGQKPSAIYKICEQRHIRIR